MSNGLDPQVLNALSALGPLSDADKQRVASTGTPLNVPANWSVIFESTPADKAYIILEGTVSIRHGDQEVAQVGAGEVIGEMALINHSLRTASVVTLTQVRALHFTDAQVRELADTVPAFGEALRASTESRSAD